MNDAEARQNARLQRISAKIRKESQAEIESTLSSLKSRPDYHPAWDYFLDLLPRLAAPEKLREAVGRPLTFHLCNQAPFELFHAMGVHPFRLASGCFAHARLASADSPVLTCPMIKSIMGAERLRDHDNADPSSIVIPTTCDWVVKYAELAGHDSESAYFMELPRLRQTEKGQARWLEEICDLVKFLERQTGRKLKRKTLLQSVQTFMDAWRALGGLIELRRQGRLSAVWFLAVANSFMLDHVETWTEHVFKAVEVVQKTPPSTANSGVLLVGSPIVFPNFKLPELIESAGMSICGDDMCVSERMWPGATQYDDPSLPGLLRALAERYHKGSTCPTFADNERRINHLFNILRNHPHIGGVIHHVLKGCHPFDIESFVLEQKLKEKGYKFLKIETDYVREDSRNILARLEAFGRI